MFARSLVRAGGEVLVTAPSASAACYHDGLVGAGEVVDQFAGLVIVEQRADGNFQRGGLALRAGAVGAEAVAATLCFVFRIETEVDEGIVAQRGGHENVAAVAAIAARRPALGDELLAAEGHTAVAAVASPDTNSCFINKHRNLQCKCCPILTLCPD